MKELEKCDETQLGKFLIDAHTIGGLRDESDLRIAQTHAMETISFCIDFLKNIKGGEKEKLEFLMKAKKEIPKFKAKQS